jgi:hypothetical protein
VAPPYYGYPLEYTSPPPAYNFSEVYLGTSTSLLTLDGGVPLPITNTGTLPMTLAAPVISGPAASDATVFATCTHVAVGATCPFIASIAPKQTGVRDATVS